ncbi:hypothetical protein PVA45_01700 [Entomospira entomophila]|uniref:Cobalamin adenosyltransferase-like domain-containing protein n=1 Tax=Entomospira entomophila TaxID=2719988 RepID=A0A968G7W4_9SPIO|nr:hypothetical protein [Entomospira entomophilus]NIZ40227.1 hypothetical protein [Entomospira entomophilus]WDI35786.1 hypothetical protein PVA45_01700 [Entomospira entomophilus]
MPTIISKAYIIQWLTSIQHQSITHFVVDSGAVLTKDAIKTLQDNSVVIDYPENQFSPPTHTHTLEQPDIEEFQYLISNKTTSKKNSYWTHLRGNQLIEKSHPIIRWRGSVDMLIAKILRIAHDIQEPSIREKLLDIATFLRRMLYADSTTQPLKNLSLWGYSLEEIQEMSHHPLIFWGVDHFFVDIEMGKTILDLNILRTEARSLELEALAAFPYGDRDDIIEACNRLSSAFYVLMFEVKHLLEDK